MKKIKILSVIIILFLTLQVNSQEFAKVGTIWTFNSQDNFFYDYHPLYYEVKEEVQFKNILCKAIYKTNHRGQENFWNYIYQDNKKVFFYNAELDSFLLLFDFGAEVNDTMQIGLEHYFGEIENPYIDVVVDSTGFEEYCDTLLKVWYLSTLVEEKYYTYASKVIECIGFTGYFHPLFGLDCSYYGNLRCFEEEAFSCKFVDYPCDTSYNTSDIVEFEVDENIKIYPNPVSDLIFVELPKNNNWTDWIIYNSTGGMIKFGKIANSNQNYKIQIPDNLKSGIYYLKILSEDKKVVVSKFSHN
jgi:hypothetical protein